MGGVRRSHLGRKRVSAAQTSCDRTGGEMSLRLD